MKEIIISSDFDFPSKREKCSDAACEFVNNKSVLDSVKPKLTVDEIVWFHLNFKDFEVKFTGRLTKFGGILIDTNEPEMN